MPKETEIKIPQTIADVEPGINYGLAKSINGYLVRRDVNFQEYQSALACLRQDNPFRLPYDTQAYAEMIATYVEERTPDGQTPIYPTEYAFALMKIYHLKPALNLLLNHQIAYPEDCDQQVMAGDMADNMALRALSIALSASDNHYLLPKAEVHFSNLFEQLFNDVMPTLPRSNYDTLSKILLLIPAHIYYYRDFIQALLNQDGNDFSRAIEMATYFSQMIDKFSKDDIKYFNQVLTSLQNNQPIPDPPGFLPLPASPAT